MSAEQTTQQDYEPQIMQIIREAAGQPVIGAAIASRVGAAYKGIEMTLERLREEGKVAYNYRGWSEPKTDLYIYSQDNGGVLAEGIDVRFAKPLTLAEAREQCQKFAERGGSTLVDVKPAVPGVESPTRPEAEDAAGVVSELSTGERELVENWRKAMENRPKKGREPGSRGYGRTFNHRDFWQQGYGAKGLDPSILTIHDRIEMDDGSTRPSFSKWAYSGDQPAPYPMRELPLVQRDAIHRVANDNCSQAAFFMASKVRQTKDGAVHGLIGYDNGNCRPREVVFYANGDVWFGA